MIGRVNHVQFPLPCMSRVRASACRWRRALTLTLSRGYTGEGIVIAWTILAVLLVLNGCDSKSDMGEQPKFKALAPNEQFADNAAARPLVAGVVPRDPASVPGGPFTENASLLPAGTIGTIAESTPIPMPITAELVERGHGQFDIYCSACHGRLGNGQGMVAQRGFMHPPSYHVPRLMSIADGHIYNVITAGYGAMFSYADRIAPADRWAVVAYVRALQAAPDVANADTDVRKTLYGLGDARAKPAGWRQ